MTWYNPLSWFKKEDPPPQMEDTLIQFQIHFVIPNVILPEEIKRELMEKLMEQVNNGEPLCLHTNDPRFSDDMVLKTWRHYEAVARDVPHIPIPEGINWNDDESQ